MHPLCPVECSASWALLRRGLLQISGRRLFPNLRHKTHIPLGGGGHSGGQVANHGVIHISQRARRAEIKHIYIILIITNTTRETSEKTTRAKEPPIPADRHCGTGEWVQK